MKKKHFALATVKQVKQKPEESVANFSPPYDIWRKIVILAQFLNQLYDTVCFRPPRPTHPNKIIRQIHVDIRLCSSWQAAWKGSLYAKDKTTSASRKK
jgi:hypothetical protein